MLKTSKQKKDDVDEVPGCFRTREYNKGNGICKQCSEYKNCKKAIEKLGYAPDKNKSKKGRKKLIINSYNTVYDIHNDSELGYSL
jgi:hypothetical protein